MSHDSSLFAYDAIPYPTRAQAQIHPERLAALGKLHGLNPAPVRTSRILELGCGDGSNLAAIAAAFPECRCIGIDLSRDAIERGREFVQRCGLGNIDLHLADISTGGIVQEAFDFIVCHGLYTWVPESAQLGILRICREHLAPDGIALISFNTLPGSCVRAELRQMLRWHVRNLQLPAERLEEARALIQFLAQATLETDEIRRGFRAELATAKEKEPGFLFHDELSDHYAPIYFHEFMDAAHRHGLQFVADADPAGVVPLSLPETTRNIVAALTDDRVEQQQYLDFLVARRFRQTLLCRADLPVSPEVLEHRVAECWFSAQARLLNPESVGAQGGVAVFERSESIRLETDFLPGKRALQYLIERHPTRIPFEELVRLALSPENAGTATETPTSTTSGQLAQFLLEACHPRVATFHGATPDVFRPSGPCPVAFPIARIQAASDSTVTSAFHLNIRLEDRWSREILVRADGSRTPSRLVEELDALAATADAAETAAWSGARADFTDVLARLTRQGLLIA